MKANAKVLNITDYDMSDYKARLTFDDIVSKVIAKANIGIKKTYIPNDDVYVEDMIKLHTEEELDVELVLGINGYEDSQFLISW